MTDSSPATPAHRHDIDGLRALAIVLVVAYHVWFGRVSGGVDVFLMISAYFLTLSLTRRATSGQPLRLGAFWLRRFARLLPAAVVTLLGMLATAYLVFPESSWPRLWEEAWASLFYVQNWSLAFAEVDYYARASATPSPLQHFWSLSVQGQVFLLWPLLIAVVVSALRGHRHLIVRALLIVFTIIFVASLAFSVVTTHTDQVFAYFDTRARLWEFAAGTLVALALPRLRLPAVVRALLGWTGVAGVVLCGIVIDVQGGFPGYLALWPILCTAFVIVSGVEPTRGGPGRLLSTRPLLALGQSAYALYLVHWPVLITYRVITGKTTVGLVDGVAIVAISLVLARVLSRDVEQPVTAFATATARQWRPSVVIGLAVVVVSVPLTVWTSHVERRTEALDAQIEHDLDQQYPGAAWLDDPDQGSLDQSLPLTPLPTQLDDEWVGGNLPCDGKWLPEAPELAENCHRTAGPDPDAKTVLAIGDSHVQQLSGPLVDVAEREGWNVVFLLRGACAMGFGEPAKAEGCEEWRRAALQYALAVHPEAVYLVTTKTFPAEDERLIVGVDEVVSGLSSAGIEVIGVRDNPRFESSMYDCALRDPNCSVDAAGHLAASNPALALGGNVAHVDFTPWLCPDGACRGRIGNVALYIDYNHLSKSYGRTLAPILARQLDERRVQLPRLTLDATLGDDFDAAASGAPKPGEAPTTLLRPRGR
ncbi:MAG: acyltransferase family protein [Aeromicrobium sp.]|uniref:acyltransferase family protein n=1 Tax=Aeromicrobium sp. TaxID=1871063 RepID=UPI0039E6409C